MDKETSICNICERSFKSCMSLARHLSQTHCMNTKDYFDKYLKCLGDGFCSVCNKETKFRNMNTGYTKVCSHSCGAKIFRSELKIDPIRQIQFIKRIADAQANVWANRSIEEKNKISDKGWESRSIDKHFVSSKFKKVEDMSETLEKLGRKDCYALGIKPNYYDSWNQSQPRISQNLANFFGVDHG